MYSISISAQSEKKQECVLMVCVFPDVSEGIGAGLWCGEVLWRLDRKREAAARWEVTWNLPTQSSTE